MTNRIITFHILLAAQFALVAASMVVNVKIGLFSMALILLSTTICLVQLSNDERTDWRSGQNTMTWLFTAWLLFYLLEIMNPNNVMEAWNINLTPYALTPLICAFVIPIVIRTKKDVELLLIIWSVFVIIFTLKGYWQKNHGFSSKDLYFLHVLGGARTHIIWSGIRYFSCFSDAANYGVHSAMAGVTFAIAGFFVDSKWKRIYFLSIAFCGIYGMGISGTRSAMGVLMGDYHHSQELESTPRRHMHIHRSLCLFLLHQYRKRQPIYPQDALFLPPYRRRLLHGARRKPAKNEGADG